MFQNILYSLKIFRHLKKKKTVLLHTPDWALRSDHTSNGLLKISFQVLRNQMFLDAYQVTNYSIFLQRNWVNCLQLWVIANNFQILNWTSAKSSPLGSKAFHCHNNLLVSNDNHSNHWQHLPAASVLTLVTFCSPDSILLLEKASSKEGRVKATPSGEIAILKLCSHVILFWTPTWTAIGWFLCQSFLD